MTQASIPRCEVTFETASATDPHGRIFRWRDRLFRAIPHEHAAFYRELCASRAIRELFDQGLVAAEVAPATLEGFGLVLEHPRVPFISYCAEWPFEMIRDAARLVCDLSAKLLRSGVVLQDSHPWNVLFEGANPVFVDWGSLRRADPTRPWPAREFRDRFLLPLWLLSAGRQRLARLSMLEVREAVTRGEVARLVAGRVSPLSAIRIWFGDSRVGEEEQPASAGLFERLRRTVERIQPGAATTEWTSYDGPDRKWSLDCSDAWPAKLHSVRSILEELRPVTLLDLGCNRGWFSEMAARNGVRVVAADIDEPSLGHLYRRARSSKLPILPLVMDVCSPTVAHGIGGAYPCAAERLRCDLVLALGLTHHLVVKRGLHFEQVAELLARFARRYLLVEFVPATDAHMKGKISGSLSWYTESGLRSALGPFFKHIRALPSSPEPRVLLCCER